MFRNLTKSFEKFLRKDDYEGIMTQIKMDVVYIHLHGFVPGV